MRLNFKQLIDPAQTPGHHRGAWGSRKLWFVQDQTSFSAQTDCECKIRPSSLSSVPLTTLGLYLQRRDTRKYAHMYTGKVFVTAGRGFDAGRRDSGGVTAHRVWRRAPVLLRVSQGCGFRVRYSIGLGRAAAVSPHMHVKDYITARDT